MDGLETYTKDERFELLSAYMDNEVSPEERKLVEFWLDTDPEFQRQYQIFMSIGWSLQSFPLNAASSKSVEDTLDAVFQRVDRRSHRWKVAGIGIAITAGLGALGTVLVGDFSPQIATRNTGHQSTSDISLLKESSLKESSLKESSLKESSLKKSSLKEAFLKEPLQNSQVANSEIQPIETESLMLALEAPPIDIPDVDSTEFYQGR